MMCISLFSYGRPVVVRCKGVRLGMCWVGSWVHKFTWHWIGLGWVGLGHLFGGLSWAGSMKIDPRTTLMWSMQIEISHVFDVRQNNSKSDFHNTCVWIVTYHN